MSFIDTLGNALFQFQDGTIKRMNKERIIGSFDLFQFQDGTIKSFAEFPDGSMRASFNSKMVRLKELRYVCDRIYFFVSIPRWYD